MSLLFPAIFTLWHFGSVSWAVSLGSGRLSPSSKLQAPMGPLSAPDTQPRRRRPFRFFSRLGLVLDTDSGFAGQVDDGRRTKPG